MKIQYESLCPIKIKNIGQIFIILATTKLLMLWGGYDLMQSETPQSIEPFSQKSANATSNQF